ncbi:MAG: OmpA family protein [Gammaproteobacteria bacterium]|nr:OmpA family protein [Gammaproteobacteria bacterium]
MPVSYTLRGFVLSIFLLGASLPAFSQAACIDYETEIKQAAGTQNLDKLESLLAALKTQADCSSAYLDWLKRSMSQIAAARADDLVQQGQIENAQTFLNRAPVTVWGTQVIHGDIAAWRKQWESAAKFYNQALDLIADPAITPRPPAPLLIQKLYNLASEAQVLAGNLEATISRSGQASGIMRDTVRGFVPKERIIPIQFGFNKKTLSKRGKKAADRLIEYLKQKGITRLNLIGHTDSKGSHKVNDRISKRRALALKQYLLKHGVTAGISVVGKGKREPLKLDSPENYTQKEIDTLNRRVEFRVK